MKKILISLFFGLLPILHSAAQGYTDSVRTEAWLHVSRSDPAKWMTRYQSSIDKYIDINRTLEDRSCDALFIGSSSVNLWDGIDRDLAPLKIIRRSYGGAAIRDMIYNYDVIARGYNPRVIVMYVANDFSVSPEDTTVGDAYDLFRVFADMIRRDYPDTPFVILSLMPSKSRAAALEKQTMLNYLLEEYAGRTPYVHYLDVTRPLYDRNGELRDELFRDDKLHLSNAGYVEWTKIIRPALLEILGDKVD